VWLKPCVGSGAHTSLDASTTHAGRLTHLYDTATATATVYKAARPCKGFIADMYLGLAFDRVGSTDGSLWSASLMGGCR